MADQPNTSTVQEHVNTALSTLFREKINSVGAGRTDAGVHARQLIIHFDGQGKPDPELRHKLNGILPPDIAVNRVIKPLKSDFHARFDASCRGYTYQMILRKSVHFREQAMWVRHQIDLEKMEKAARILMEYEDFGAFCKAHGANKTNICRIDHAYFERKQELLLFHIEADRFLRGMVRAIVGTLLLVGRDALSLDQFREIIQSGDRKNAGPNAEARGLFLVKVGYPDGILE